MPIKIDRGLRRRIRSGSGTFTVQVIGVPDEQAAEALRRARNQIMDLDAGPDSAPGLEHGDANAPKYVSQVIAARPGPFLTINPGYVPVRHLLRIPEIVVAHLDALGVTEARVRELPQRPMYQRPKLYEVGPAVSLRLYPAPLYAYRPTPTPVPEDWIAAGLAWLKAEAGDPLPDLWATAFIAEFPIDLGSAEAFMRAGRLVETDCWIRAGTFPHQVSAVWEYGLIPSFVLQTGGSDYGTAGVVAAAERLKDLGRSLAPTLSLGMLSVTERWPALGLSPPAWGQVEKAYAPPELVEAVCDELLFDAYPYQIIGPGHLHWLGGVPDGARELAGRRFELEFGPLEAWLASAEARAEVLGRAREALAPALRSTDEVVQLLRLRRQRRR